MNTLHLTSENNGFRYGLGTAAGMAVYFLLASLLHLIDRIEFSFLNGLIMAFGISRAIGHLRQVKGRRMTYFEGYGTGMITALVASVAFGLFFVVYTVFNPAIMEQLRALQYFGFDWSVTIAFLAIILQGAMGGVIISLIAMQYYKNPDHESM